MIKTTYEALIEAQPALNALINTPMPAKLSYRLSKSLNKVSSALKGLEDKRINMLKAVAKLDKANNKYDFPTPEIEEEFRQKYEAERKREVEVDICYFTIDELQDAKIAPGVFMALEKIGIVLENNIKPIH